MITSEPRYRRRIHATVLRPPLVERCRADVSLPKQRRDRFAQFGTFELYDDLAVRKPRLAHGKTLSVTTRFYLPTHGILGGSP